MADIAKAVEGYSLRALWLQDNPLNTKDAYIALTVAALNTQRLILAPWVSNTIIRHPSVTVGAICTKVPWLLSGTHEDAETGEPGRPGPRHQKRARPKAWTAIGPVVVQ